MPVSTILEIPQLTEAQSQKAATTNIGLSAMAEAIADIYTVDTSVATSTNFEIELEYDDSDDLSVRTALRFIYLNIAAGATHTFRVIHPDAKHLFYAKNSTTQTVTIKTADASGVVLGPGASQIIYCDGTACVGLLAGSTEIAAAADFTVMYFGTPVASEVIAEMITARTVTLQENFLGSVGNVETNPASTYVLDVADIGGVSPIALGTISISTGGSFTFDTTDTGVKTISAGRRLRITAPSTSDASIKDIMIAIAGTVQINQ